MKKVTLAILVAFVVSFAAAPVVAAGGAAELSKQCQEALKKTPNKEAEKLCKEGDQLLKDGKTADAEAKFKSGLEMLGGKADMGDKY